MALYAIGDLHLSSKVDKPMDIFGPQWTMHHEKIKEHWYNNVKQEDTVLVPGDISWGINMEEAMEDLKWIEALPGKKILLKGNHDYWWSSITKLNDTFATLKFLQNNYFAYEDYAICGTRGWISPNGNKFTQQDEKVYYREVHRLKLSLDSAKKAGYTKIVCMLHYPPTNEQHEPSLFTEVCEEYGVSMVIYGHLHGKESYDAGVKGIYHGIPYYLVSCDYLEFQLYQLL
ncbi:metallophosphoesterase [Clostridium formicaceticum]|nr:metallophosphoesterase [Clostridium formicaceticum]AOY78495.1 serine/threonine protein phosphatase [Clostridium formicaceticum]